MVLINNLTVYNIYKQIHQEATLIVNVYLQFFNANHFLTFLAPEKGILEDQKCV